jgi:hypothetical protein
LADFTIRVVSDAFKGMVCCLMSWKLYSDFKRVYRLPCSDTGWFMQLFRRSSLKDCMRFPCKPKLSANQIQYTPRSNFISCTAHLWCIRQDRHFPPARLGQILFYIASREALKRQRIYTCGSPTRPIHHSVFLFSNAAQNQRNQAVDPESWFQLQCCALAVWLYTLKAGKQGTLTWQILYMWFVSMASTFDHAALQSE